MTTMANIIHSANRIPVCICKATSLACKTVPTRSIWQQHYYPTLLPYRRPSSSSSHRTVSTAASSTSADATKNKSRQYYHRHVFAAAVATAAASSLYARHIRQEKLSTLITAKDSGLLSTCAAKNNIKNDDFDHDVDSQIIMKRLQQSTTPSSKFQQKQKYNLPLLIETITRAGLVGSTKSVKEELDHLRKWHAERGYNGGLVVRDLSRPLFTLDVFDYFRQHRDDDNDNDNGSVVGNDDNSERNKNNGNLLDKLKQYENSTHVMNQRECYYLYYEIHSNGETRQQIFCRGTTLLSDVWTCLKTWFVYDEELKCHVHYGFNMHANRVVEDVLPLLVPPMCEGDRRGIAGHRATVEVCGHSLGGAVAMLVAIKLRKRGYVVTRATSLAGPRFCKGMEEREALEKWLPKETLRIENDLDIVTYLPPNGVSVGDKLWLASGKKKDEAYMLPVEWIQDLSIDHSWVESVWLNLRLLETMWNQSQTHRVSSYVKKLEQLVCDINSNDRVSESSAAVTQSSKSDNIDDGKE